MTVKECYEAMGGDYEDVMRRLRKDERVEKFLMKVLDDKSFQLLTDSMAARNMDEAFRAAHTLKGICQNLVPATNWRRNSGITESIPRSWM